VNKTVVSFVFIPVLIEFILSSAFVPSVYAGDLSGVWSKESRLLVEEGTSRTAVSEGVLESTVPRIPESLQISNNKSGAASAISGYPESFIIPKGVCEIGKPVMVIKKWWESSE
jgi:hypothetical protein